MRHQNRLIHRRYPDASLAVIPSDALKASSQSDARALALCMRRSEHPNVLLIGADTAIDKTLEEMHPWLRTPVVSWVPGKDDWPATSFATLIARGVESLTTAQQERLRTLITERGESLQIVSTTRTPLYPHIDQGKFLTPLYYRLNILMLDV